MSASDYLRREQFGKTVQAIARTVPHSLTPMWLHNMKNIQRPANVLGKPQGK
jgi:hypothetical protein